jgi:tRNA (uracil-5-)-methyltransferase TRM9
MNLYSKFADKFSSTRQKPWEGWLKFQPEVEKLKQPITVLDLGCGNGRFLKLLITNYELRISKYTGLDNSDDLLKIASDSFKDGNVSHKFINKDLNEVNWDENLGKFDLIVAFGLMHHLESFDARKNLIQKASDLLTENGLLVISFWMFKENENFMKKHLIKDLGDDDYILSFANDAERFCHYSDQNEIENLYRDTNLAQVDSYRSDGFGNEMNQYIVSQRVRKLD